MASYPDRAVGHETLPDERREADDVRAMTTEGRVEGGDCDELVDEG